MKQANKNNRIAFISFLQFVGVISVIFGHSMNSIPVPTIFTDIKAWIYTYHMPLFFFISAFLFSYKGGYDQGYSSVLLKRFWRLIVPYLIWNALFIVPKILFKDFIYDEVELSFRYFFRIMLRPRDNILGHTWFLFALFEMYLIAIFLDKAKRIKTLWIPVIMLLAVLNAFGVKNRWLAVGDLMMNGVFFWCGLLAGSIPIDSLKKSLKDKYLTAATVFVTVFTTLVWVFLRDMAINTLVLGFSVLILAMILQVKLQLGGGLIEFVSRNSFPIYIMHWPVIMISRLLFYQKLNLPPTAAMAINAVLGFFIPCGIAFFLRKLKAPWCRKICTVVFGM